MRDACKTSTCARDGKGARKSRTAPGIASRSNSENMEISLLRYQAGKKVKQDTKTVGLSFVLQ
jgi:hypothetical protein